MNTKFDHNKIQSDTESEASLRLLMYTAMPARDSAWVAGYEAARSNYEIEENPFKSGEQEFTCWENGWWSGFYEEDYLTSDVIDELYQYKQLEEKTLRHSYAQAGLKDKFDSLSVEQKTSCGDSDLENLKNCGDDQHKVTLGLNWLQLKTRVIHKLQTEKLSKILIISSILLATLLSINLLLLD